MTMREETVKDLRPCLSLSSKIVFPKNMATAKRRAVFKSHWRGMAIKGTARDRPFFLQIPD
jgi:hypothetical protein